MALEFTGLPDRHGPALYLLDQNPGQDDALVALGTAVDDATDEDTQVVYLRAQSAEGQQVADFYNVTQFPAALIIMDDDQVYHSWFFTLPQPDEAVTTIARAGARLRGDA